MKPKVTCFIIAPLKPDFEIRQECLQSVMAQDYENFDVLIHYEKPIEYKSEDLPNPNIHLAIANVYKNCSINRNIARKMALTTDAEYFLVADSDIVIPTDAITKFMIQAGPNRKSEIPALLPDGRFMPIGTPIPEKHIQGGWYPIFGRDDGVLGFYPCGEFVADNTIERYYQPQPHLIRVDYLGIGCMFITRKALEDISFSDGLDTWVTSQAEKQPVIAGECLAFGNSAYEKGYEMYMNGYIICRHIKELVCQPQ